MRKFIIAAAVAGSLAGCTHSETHLQYDGAYDVETKITQKTEVSLPEVATNFLVFAGAVAYALATR